MSMKSTLSKMLGMVAVAQIMNPPIVPEEGTSPRKRKYSEGAPRASPGLAGSRRTGRSGARAAGRCRRPHANATAMLNVEFEGALEIKKPPNMTDEQCSSAWAMPLDAPIDIITGPNGETEKAMSRRWLMHYQPSKEDLEALTAGRGLWLTIHATQLVPHSLFTMNENDEGNF